MIPLNILFYIVFFLRLITIFISARNEKKLKKLGAVEYGKSNSTILVLFHFAYYAACLVEGYTKGAFYTDNLTTYGLIIYIVAIAVLYYVIYAIRHVWTVKLIIAPKQYHILNTNVLFRFVKHPNYFLNIIPELIGIALVFHAWFTLIIGFPIYLIPLIIRIRQEERVMKEHFEQY
jgi:isoprenylcysteine carboxyl methyltransferase (ICMT) family protein YpbQ